MAPKRNPSSTHSAPAAKPSPSTSTSTATPASTSSKLAQTTTSAPSTRASKSSASAQTTTLSPHSTATEILTGIWNTYLSRTPQRVKLLDTFMAFLVAVGVLQFVYCVAGGNYPFNAFLSGFGATVGQFVLTASLRIQTNVENRAEFKAVSHER